MARRREFIPAKQSPLKDLAIILIAAAVVIAALFVYMG